MSITTRSREPHTNTSISTSGPSRSLRAVPDQSSAAKARTDSEEKLWKALHANANSTSTQLAGAAEIGKSTAGKILLAWHKNGSVTRTPGITTGGRRAADLWAINATSTDDDSESTEHTPANDNSAEAKLGDATARVHKRTQQATASPHPDTTNEVPPIDDEAGQEINTEPTVKAKDAQPTAPVPDHPATNTSAAEGSASGKRTRLKPGVLHGMVEDYLRDHPDDEFGPTRVARDLNRSSGAVNNALERLAKDGTAVKTKEHPKRFSLAPAPK